MKAVLSILGIAASLCASSRARADALTPLEVAHALVGQFSGVAFPASFSSDAQSYACEVTIHASGKISYSDVFGRKYAIEVQEAWSFAPESTPALMKAISSPDGLARHSGYDSTAEADLVLNGNSLQAVSLNDGFTPAVACRGLTLRARK